MRQLINRKIIAGIIKFLEDDEIVVLHGARQVGKTSIINYLISRILKGKVKESNLVYLDLEDFNLVDICDNGVDEVVNHLRGINCDFNKKIYLFIDEIQYLKNPSSFLKLFYDRYRGKIKLVVSGSSSFAIKSKFKDSLAGRSIDFEIFTLDFEEFLWFKKEEINLKTKLSKALETRLKKLYEEFALIGGYPAITLEPSIEKKELKLKQIINTYIKKDIGDLANIRNINKFNNLLKILAGQTGQLLNILELSNTLNLAKQTVSDYLFILENTYIIRQIYPFHKNIRSELTKMPKVFLEDTGIANILANKTFARVLSGELFESSIYSNLRKNIGVDNIHFWRTNKGQEIDFIVENKIFLNSLISPAKSKEKFLPLEAKLSYSCKAMKNLIYFGEKYKVSNLFCVTLNKQEGNKGCEKVIQLYPWETLLLISQQK
ncbi:MAG: ATP-binding protein [Candidatus Omnitrophota bacterium]